MSAVDEPPYIVPTEDGQMAPRPIYQRLRALPEFAHLQEGEPIVEFLLFAHPITRQGRSILGECHLPGVQGRLKGVCMWLVSNLFGHLPDFIVMLDATFWAEGSDRQREILVYHEMKHMAHQVDKEGELRFDVEGNPVWGLVGHDVEEFHDTVRRYGAYSDDIAVFLDAAQSRDARP